MRSLLSIIARKEFQIHFCCHTGRKSGTRSLHLGHEIGSKSTYRKQNALVEEGKLYNIEWLNEVLDGLDRNAIRGGDDYFTRVIRLCGHLKALIHGRRIHDHLIRMGIAETLPLGNHIVQMYIKCGSLVEARKIFNSIPYRDLLLWTTMITAYAQLGQWQEVFILFDLMELNNVEPAKFTYIAVLKAFSSPEALAGARLIHNRLSEFGGDTDEVVKAALIDTYGKCGSLEDARKIFKTMRQQTLVSWNAMIAAYAQHGHYKVSFELFREMQRQYVRPDKVTFATILNACTVAADLQEGKRVHASIIENGYESDVLINNALVAMYGTCGNMENAREIFNQISQKDAAVWTPMIRAYAQHGHCKQAFVLLKEMQSKGLIMDSETCITFLGACASLLALEEGKAVHTWIVKKGLEQNVFVGTALVDMYAKCGSLEDARAMFDMMQERNLFAWNSMILAYVQCGHCMEAIQIFLEMQQEGVKPTASTFTSALLACSHGGLVHEGFLYFVSMSRDYSVLPTAEHCGCVISLLGRPGWLKEAEDFIHRLPAVDTVVWNAFLVACRIHADMERGKFAAERILQLSSQNPGAYVVLAGIYDAMGRSNLATNIRESMVAKGVSKQRVSSSILIRNTGCHEFVTGDTSHPKTEKVHAELEGLRLKMEKAGYVPNAKQLVMHDVAEELQGESLCYHSEKLAIGLGLIKTPAGTPLRIIKNYRVCADCHTAIKLISKIVNRTIIVRDGSSQFHRFKEGICSCKDYW